MIAAVCELISGTGVTVVLLFDLLPALSSGGVIVVFTVLSGTAVPEEEEKEAEDFLSLSL